MGTVGGLSAVPGLGWFAAESDACAVAAVKILATLEACGCEAALGAMCGESDCREACEAVFDCGVLWLVGTC